MVHQKVFSRAAQLAGGRSELASRLGVRPEDIDAWIAGEVPPIDSLAAASEIVCDHVVATLDRLHTPSSSRGEGEAHRL